jgi:hypothetical protein
VAGDAPSEQQGTEWLFRATGVRIGSRSVLNIHLRVLDD